MVTRIASLTLAACMLTSAGCAMWGDSCSGGMCSGMFGRMRHGQNGGDCCDPCGTPCCGQGCGVVSHMPGNLDGPILTTPPPSVPPMPGATAVPNVTTAPPTRIGSIQQAVPVPYHP
jgi:hypothetical protein